MNKSEYLSSLAQLLSELPEADRKEILFDYEEHFRAGADEGKTEEEVALRLGSPESLSRLFRADYLVSRSENKGSTRDLARAALAVMGLGVFNVLIMAPPFLVMLGLYAALVAVALGLSLGPVVALVLYPVDRIGGVSLPGLLLTGVGISALGLLCLIGVAYGGRLLYGLVVRYLRTNLEIIRGK